MSTMPKLKLYNTMSRTKEVFEPLRSDNVRMYVCGPTVYDYAHIGNARPMIVFDVLFRLLRHIYGESHVTYARNITDVDDKINARAFERWTRKRPLLAEMRDLTEGTVAQFNKDLKALNVLDPTHTPRATDFVANGEQPMDMVRIIAKLVERGVAYAAEGHVLFSPSAMDSLPGLPRYGALSRRNLDDMLAGARVDVAPYKRDPMDFVLWKPSDPATEPGWDSPWGFGRPGWHIECSAMAGALLGQQFDIHGGGIDLVFPHHENEIAQSCCAFGLDKMASIWMHNGFLQVEGRKMSKSDGNFVTIDELLNTDKFGGRSWPGEVLRLAMLKTHYRQPIDWTVRALEEAEATLEGWWRLLSPLPPRSILFGSDGSRRAVDDRILAALEDDLNVASLLPVLHELAREASQPGQKGCFFGEELASQLGFQLLFLGLFPKYQIGLETESDGQLMSAARFRDLDMEQLVPETGHIKALIDSRLDARRAKNFAESDRIRDELAAMGIALKDGKDTDGNPTTTWEVKR
ncbi:MAG: cysteine--tRNA ligase [Hyphomicrobiales bacterium]|nr:cysteine--tRNA ligase [Hyphomicrobiales bacterium]